MGSEWAQQPQILSLLESVQSHSSQVGEERLTSARNQALLKDRLQHHVKEERSHRPQGALGPWFRQSTPSNLTVGTAPDAPEDGSTPPEQSLNDELRQLAQSGVAGRRFAPGRAKASPKSVKPRLSSGNRSIKEEVSRVDEQKQPLPHILPISVDDERLRVVPAATEKLAKELAMISIKAETDEGLVALQQLRGCATRALMHKFVAESDGPWFQRHEGSWYREGKEEVSLDVPGSRRSNELPPVQSTPDPSVPWFQRPDGSWFRGGSETRRSNWFNAVKDMQLWQKRVAAAEQAVQIAICSGDELALSAAEAALEQSLANAEQVMVLTEQVHQQTPKQQKPTGTWFSAVAKPASHENTTSFEAPCAPCPKNELTWYEGDEAEVMRRGGIRRGLYYDAVAASTNAEAGNGSVDDEYNQRRRDLRSFLYEHD